MKLHYLKKKKNLLEISDAIADAIDVCTRVMQVCACNPMPPSFIFCPPTYYHFFPLNSINPLLMHVSGLFISATNLEKSVR